MIEYNKIYNCDCLEFMKKLPDNYFDLCITDPPYGINIGSKVGGDKLAPVKEYNAFNDSKIPEKEYFDEIVRVSKNQIIFGGNYFLEYLKNTSCFIVRDKDNSGNFADCELAWTSFKSAVRKFKFKWQGMLQENMRFKEERFHPTQKPIALGRWLIENYAKENDTIFDPFAGSGTFLLSAKQLNHKWIGCEKESDYCEIIKKRLQQNTLNDLF